LHLLIQLSKEAHAVVFVQECLTVNRSFENELCTHSVLSWRSIVHQKQPFAVFTLEINLILERFGCRCRECMRDRTDHLFIGNFDGNCYDNVTGEITLDKGLELRFKFFSRFLLRQQKIACEGCSDWFRRKKTYAVFYGGNGFGFARLTLP